MTILYFAYGSNMMSSRLAQRTIAAKVIGRAVLYDWGVKFSKKSRDGSGKANLFYKPGLVTWGSLYEIGIDEISKLDRIEKGYARTRVKVTKDNGEIAEAETYISDSLVDNPVAFDSYKQMVILGAIEHGLPTEYIQYLQQLPSIPEKVG
ncbi:MAG: gamma-glutamylcyclotransferase family protein [Cyanobacteriota bacterium]|nr:gamma-glutamylcyclotransferase family protein [Cyanobacteriota bacterium]